MIITAEIIEKNTGGEIFPVKVQTDAAYFGNVLPRSENSSALALPEGLLVSSTITRPLGSRTQSRNAKGNACHSLAAHNIPGLLHLSPERGHYYISVRFSTLLSLIAKRPSTVKAHAIRQLKQRIHFQIESPNRYCGK